MNLTLAIVIMVLLTIAYVLSSMKANASLKRAKQERNEIYRNCFLKGLAGILAKMAKADGTVSGNEENVVMKLFSDMGLSDADLKVCTEAFRIAKDSALPASYYASLFAPYSTRESKLLVYEVLWDIAAADKHFAAGEEKFLNDLLGWFGLEQTAYDGNLRSHARKFDDIDKILSEAGKKLEGLVNA